MEVREQQLAHLLRLTEALTSNGLTAELADKDDKLYLTVARANTPTLNVEVECRQTAGDLWSFWLRPSQHPIGSVDDLHLVVSRIAIVVRPVEAGE